MLLTMYLVIKTTHQNVFSYQKYTNVEQTILKTPNCKDSRRAIRCVGIAKFNGIPEDFKKTETYDNFKQK